MDTNHDPLGCMPDAPSSSTVRRSQNNSRATSLPNPLPSSTQAKPNLLEVPFEIRRRILSLLVGVNENRRSNLRWVHWGSCVIDPVRVETTCKLHPNILRTCKKLYKEGTRILHQENNYVALSGFPNIVFRSGHRGRHFPWWEVSVRDPHEHGFSDPHHLHLATGNGIIHPVMAIQCCKPNNPLRILACVQDLPFLSREVAWVIWQSQSDQLRAFSFNPDRGFLPELDSLVNIYIRSSLDPSSLVAIAAFLRDNLVVRFGKMLGHVKIGEQHDLQDTSSLEKQLWKSLKVNFDNNECRSVNHMLEFTFREYRRLEAFLATEQSSMVLRCIPRVFEVLWQVRGSIGEHREQLNQLEGWICWTVGMLVLDTDMLNNNGSVSDGCSSDSRKVEWARRMLKRTNDLLKNFWLDFDAIEHHTRLHLRMAELALISELPGEIEKELLQALVLLTPYDLLPPAGLYSDDPLTNNPPQWQQWARSYLEDENRNFRIIIYLSTSLWFKDSEEKRTAVKVLQNKFAGVEALIVEKFGPPKFLTCPMRFEKAFDFI